MHYLVLSPRDRAPDELRVLCFLHGKGHHRTTLRRSAPLLCFGLPRLAFTGALPRDKDGRAFPFVVVCPHRRSGSWDGLHEAIVEIAEHVRDKHAKRDSAWFVTGISMGADETWRLTKHAEGKIAAVVPVSPEASVAAEALTSTPAWVFAADQDDKEAYRAALVKTELASVREIDGTLTRFNCVKGRHDRGVWNKVYKRRDVYVAARKRSAVARGPTPSGTDRRDRWKACARRQSGQAVRR
jgi:predicted peptidase